VGHFDGSSVPNPGEMTIGGRIVEISSGDIICTYSERAGSGTNNQAEYLSLIKLLEKALENNISKLYLRGDSKLVVNQVNGSWRCSKHTLQPLQKRCRELLAKFDEWNLEHVHREYNKEADKLTR
jgi:ribonuclease HI